MSRPLRVARAHQLEERTPERRWLIEGLWCDEAVGIVGGEPKCGKSFLALDIAVAVASGAPCLKRYAVHRPGRVLLHAAEDAPHIVRQRLEGIARHSGHTLDDLDILVVTEPSIRLDLDDEAHRLMVTVEKHGPRLLILDPFVRLHRIDENDSGQVARVLGCLRELQRRTHCAILLVHHARKSSGRQRPGQNLRGSSEFHAWGDSNLYLRRHGERITLTVEHRAAPEQQPVELRLAQERDDTGLQVIEQPAAVEALAVDPRQRVLATLEESPEPIPLEALRQAVRLRKASLCATLRDLLDQQLVVKLPTGYARAATPVPKPSRL